MARYLWLQQSTVRGEEPKQDQYCCPRTEWPQNDIEPNKVKDIRYVL